MPTTVPNDTRQWGMLIYDIPTNNMKLYMRIYNKIRRKAIMLNKSVYLLQWGMRDAMKTIIDQAVAETGQSLTADFLPFDKEANAHVEQMAVYSLERDIKESLKRLADRITKALESTEDSDRFDPDYKTKIQDQLRNAHALAVMFGFEGNILGLIDIAKATIDAEYGRLRTDRVVPA